MTVVQMAHSPIAACGNGVGTLAISNRLAKRPLRPGPRTVRVMANPIKRPNSQFIWFQVDVPPEIRADLDELPPDLRQQFPCVGTSLQRGSSGA